MNIELKDIIDMVQEYVGDDAEITEDTDLITDAGLSSFDAMMIFEQIQEQYHIEAKLDDIQDVRTVSDIFACLQKE